MRTALASGEGNIVLLPTDSKHVIMNSVHGACSPLRGPGHDVGNFQSEAEAKEDWSATPVNPTPAQIISANHRAKLKLHEGHFNLVFSVRLQHTTSLERTTFALSDALSIFAPLSYSLSAPTIQPQQCPPNPAPPEPPRPRGKPPPMPHPNHQHSPPRAPKPRLKPPKPLPPQNPPPLHQLATTPATSSPSSGPPTSTRRRNARSSSTHSWPSLSPWAWFSSCTAC